MAFAMFRRYPFWRRLLGWLWFVGFSSARNPVLLQPRWGTLFFWIGPSKGDSLEGPLDPLVAPGLQTFFKPFSGLWVSAQVMATYPSHSNHSIPIKFVQKFYVQVQWLHTHSQPFIHLHCCTCAHPCVFLCMTVCYTASCVGFRKFILKSENN